MKIGEIEELLKQLEVKKLPEAMIPFREDERTGVKKLLEKYEKKILVHEKEVREWGLKCTFDAVFHEYHRVVVGIDEVGRGPLAGPVVAAAVILPYNVEILGLKDSKKLSEAKREVLYDLIREKALSVGVGVVDAPIIDEINILQATFKAMNEAIEALDQEYDIILVDGDKAIPGRINKEQHTIIGGDDKSASIAAASVIAKVTRDRMMKAYANTYEGYDWENNKGYGSSKHYEAIRAHGLTPLHRRSFLKNEGIV